MQAQAYLLGRLDTMTEAEVTLEELVQQICKGRAFAPSHFSQSRKLADVTEHVLDTVDIEIKGKLKYNSDFYDYVLPWLQEHLHALVPTASDGKNNEVRLRGLVDNTYIYTQLHRHFGDTFPSWQAVSHAVNQACFIEPWQERFGDDEPPFDPACKDLASRVSYGSRPGTEPLFLTTKEQRSPEMLEKVVKRVIQILDKSPVTNTEAVIQQAESDVSELAQILKASIQLGAEGSNTYNQMMEIVWGFENVYSKEDIYTLVCLLGAGDRRNLRNTVFNAHQRNYDGEKIGPRTGIAILNAAYEEFKPPEKKKQRYHRVYKDVLRALSYSADYRSYAITEYASVTELASDEYVTLPELQKLTGIVAPMGTGKTTAMIQAAATFERRRRIFFVVPRISLENTYEAHAEGLRNLGYRVIVTCAQSLHKYHERMQGSIVFIDEATIIQRDFADGSTHKKLMGTAQTLLDLRKAYKIIVCDAFLDTTTVEWLEAAVGCKMAVHQFTRPGEDHLRTFHREYLSEDSMIAQVMQHEHYAIYQYSKNQCALTVNHLQRLGKNPLLITGETNSEPDAMTFMQSPSLDVLTSMGYDGIVYNTAMATGVSILGDFNIVACSFSGLGANESKQAAGRVRCAGAHRIVYFSNQLSASYIGVNPVDHVVAFQKAQKDRVAVAMGRKDTSLYKRLDGIIEQVESCKTTRAYALWYRQYCEVGAKEDFLCKYRTEELRKCFTVLDKEILKPSQVFDDKVASENMLAKQVRLYASVPAAPVQPEEAVAALEDKKTPRTNEQKCALHKASLRGRVADHLLNDPQFVNAAGLVSFNTSVCDGQIKVTEVLTGKEPYQDAIDVLTKQMKQKRLKTPGGYDYYSALWNLYYCRYGTSTSEEKSAQGQFYRMWKQVLNGEITQFTKNDFEDYAILCHNAALRSSVNLLHGSRLKLVTPRDGERPVELVKVMLKALHIKCEYDRERNVYFIDQQSLKTFNSLMSSKEKANARREKAACS